MMKPEKNLLLLKQVMKKVFDKKEECECDCGCDGTCEECTCEAEEEE